MHSHDRTRRDLLRLGAGALAAATSIGIAGCSTGASGPTTVSMTADYEYDPGTVTVPAGGRVVWTNDSDVAHTVTAYEDRIPAAATYFASGGFEGEPAARDDIDGGLVAAGDAYEHTFDVAGTYEYFCVPHEGSGMKGTVRVTE